MIAALPRKKAKGEASMRARRSGSSSAIRSSFCASISSAGSGRRSDGAQSACAWRGTLWRSALPLPVSAPFHTSLMQPAGERLAEAIAEIAIATPAVPVVHNVHAATESDPEQIRQLLVRQIHSPVQWTGCVRAMQAAGVNRIVECGPGKVLSGLNRRIDKSLQSFVLEEPESLQATATALQE